MIETRPGFGDGRGVGEHGDGAVDGGEGAVAFVAAGDDDGFLVVDADLCLIGFVS